LLKGSFVNRFAYPITKDARTTTSLDSFEFRQKAAGEIMMGHFYFYNTVGANNTRFVIIYSDGGKEEWAYATGAPASPQNRGNLVLGDGVPKCGS
jgi:hypothetical protein